MWAGLEITFNTASLVEYMLKSGRFDDPVSRIPFTDQQLCALDRQVGQVGDLPAATTAAPSPRPAAIPRPTCPALPHDAAAAAVAAAGRASMLSRLASGVAPAGDPAPLLPTPSRRGGRTDRTAPLPV